jgi:hypothetical protein
MEVGNWPPLSTGYLHPPSLTNLPRYLPQLHHTSGFSGEFNLPIVALKASRVVSRFMREPRKGSKPAPQSPAELREIFQLPSTAQIILISVAKDTPLERYWEWRTVKEIPQRLSQLGISAVTIPNFSYFPEAPPWHTLWNFQRMMRVAEEFSAVGLGVIPHVSAITAAHRQDWARLFREQPHLTMVVREFQTGARTRKGGNAVFDDLRQLREDIGRDLHPIIVGGARYWRELQTHFPSFTVVDSYPFFATVHRHEITVAPDGAFDAKPHPLPVGAPIDALWEQNYMNYCRGLRLREVVEKAVQTRSKKSSPSQQCSMEFNNES